MKTMGLRRLVLVSTALSRSGGPRRASGAGDVLARAQVVGSMRGRLAGTVFAAAMTARRRELAFPKSARDAAGW